MKIADFIASQRNEAKPPGADIRSRWASRVVTRGLHHQGAEGATTYLRDYGKGISAAKVIALALMAEQERCQAIANGFWVRAYAMTTGQNPGATPSLGETNTGPLTKNPDSAFTLLPAHLQPGSLLTMQPKDGSRSREDYINDSSYLAQPKRDGQRIVVFMAPTSVVYQSRSTSLITSPSQGFDTAFQAAAKTEGVAVLDGELLYRDASGGEHRSGSQAAQANATNGHPEAGVTAVISIFKALFAKGVDLTTASEPTRIAAAGRIVALAQRALRHAGVTGIDIEQVPTATTAAQKRALVTKQQAEGREGEVWVRTDTAYLSGKSPGEVMVRTKYLDETEVVITGLTPTTVAGRPFGALEVADLTGRHAGRVGTGFDGEDAYRIAHLVAHHPEGIRIIVRHQGRTENGILWHARFLRIVGPVGMAA